MKDNIVKIYYIYHSGFAVETENHVLIFDYYKEAKENKNAPVISEKYIRCKKNIFVFSSHSHGDHFNRKIYNWKSYNKNIHYILSSDIKDIDLHANCFIMSENEEKHIEDVYIRAYGSTDIGISFLVKVDNRTIFHAGDLNWWHWKEDSAVDNKLAEGAFKAQIEKLKVDIPIDIAFFPVDPRLEEYYYIGGQYFAEKIHPKLFVPMHFADNLSITKEFSTKIKNLNVNTAIIEAPGQEIIYK
jgi:L-ascorbate metabolism protein UlaG (beta-lactamase superfamily)